MTDEQGRQTQTTRAGWGPSVPRTIAGRYTLLAELGRGGMGVVWRAEDTVIGRHVAIKELTLPSGAEEAGVFQERVLREVRTGGRLNDPAVVTVYDVVTEHDATFIVMELVEAPTLSELVRAHGPLPPQQVAAIGEQVLSALQAAHEAGIVHRDVKPGNLMVAPNGRVKLTDFGIAQAIDDPRLTTSGMLVGSPAFMAPERVAGREALPASDLWALGVTLFFAVEGTVAFERPTTAATLHAIMTEVPYLTRAQGPLASAIMGLLISAPEARISGGQAGALLRMAGQQQHLTTPPNGQQTIHYAQAPTAVGAHPIPPGGAPAPAGKARRAGLVTAAAVLGAALLVGGFFLGKPVWSPPVDEAMLPTMTYGAGGQIGTLSYSTSDLCVNTPLREGRRLTDSNWVDCEDERHDLELYNTTNGAWVSDSGASADGATLARYPGEESLRDYAETDCGTIFHTNRIQEEAGSTLRYRAVIPTEQEWNERPLVDESSDDYQRTIYCFVSDSNGQREGSVTNETY